MAVRNLTVRNLAVRNRKFLLVLLMMIALIYNSRPIEGCGPFVARAIFTYDLHPDFPIARFAAGELGVLRPKYARSYLFVAYRYFTGTGFDREEQKGVASLWDERLKPYWDNESEEGPVKKWLDARARVAGATELKELDVVKSEDKQDRYLYYYNCTDDAFQTATDTLNGLITRFGASSQEVKAWLEAQDRVFTNCSNGPAIPDAPPAAWQAPLKDDRTYQIASANFYAGNFDAAEKTFRSIAADASSPWKQIAPYLAARALVRKGTLNAKEGEIDETALKQAEAQLKTITTDQKLTAYHAAAKRLLSFVAFRLHPVERLRELAASLLKKNSGPTIKQDLWDYTLLLDKYENDVEEEKKFDALPAVIREDDMTDWIMTFQLPGDAALNYSLEKWEKTSSLPWMVASLAKLDGQNPRTPKLLEAAAKVKPSSPAFATVAFHRLRLMIDTGKKDAARAELDGLLAGGDKAFPPSTLNSFRALRMRVARNLEEFLKYAERVPSAVTYDEDGRELPSDISEDEQLKAYANGKISFDSDATEIMNEKLPVSVLKQAALSEALPAHLHQRVALAAWVRVALLDNDAAGKPSAEALEKLIPDLKQYLDDYLSAATPEERKYAALYLILKFPGSQPYVSPGIGRQTPLGEIDNYRDNWWCSFDPTDESNQLGHGKQEGETVYPDFLSSTEKAETKADMQKLAALGFAPNYLCAEAVRWANAKPGDPRVPEALHLAVKSTRYGCTNDDTGKFSKQAYDLLHRKYPKSTWAEKTKYWYKG